MQATAMLEELQQAKKEHQKYWEAEEVEKWRRAEEEEKQKQAKEVEWV